MGSKPLPKRRGYEELRKMTGNFSTLLGAGSFGSVYKGTFNDGKQIAVKILTERPNEGEILEGEFMKEFKNLLTLTHKNIIELDGYCYEVDKKYNDAKKKTDSIVRTALCLELAPGGNLCKYISAGKDPLPWETCYKIIKGTCEGLHYLHHHPSGPVCHLDLKPANILLNREMVPKISDFGLSMLMNEKTRKNYAGPAGTVGYRPVEYTGQGPISEEFDIYSLGVIIFEIIAGAEIYSEIDEILEEHIDVVVKKWMERKLSRAYWEHVRTCLKIALRCVDDKPEKRPKIEDIIDELNLMENRKQSGPPAEGHTPSGKTSSEDELVVLYVTKLGTIRKVYDDCSTIRQALQSLHVKFVEKDVSNEYVDHRKELKQLVRATVAGMPPLPVLCKGQHFIDGPELIRLYQQGKLARSITELS